MAPSKQVLPGPFHWAMDKLVYHDSDDGAMRLRKTVLSLTMALSCLQVSLQLNHDVAAKRYTSAGVFATQGSLLLYMIITKTAPDLLVDIFGVLATLSVVAVDSLASSGWVGRRWFWMILVIDLFLVCRASNFTMNLMTALVACWISIDSLEHVFHYGLYDMMPDPAICDCESPPCVERLDVLNTYGAILIVFFLDSYFTRSFFTQQLRERQRMEHTIQTVQKLAENLAVFEVDDCEATLSDPKLTTDMPPKLLEEFKKIVHNLKLFKVYLPDGLFTTNLSAYIQDGNPLQPLLSEEQMSDSTVPPPGVTHPLFDGALSLPVDRKPVISMAFTDIKGSTAMWEEAPSSMRKALAVHNGVVREMMVRHRGYEVKIIGDAFMVAFGSAYEACCFGLDVQEELQDAIFPPDIDALRIRIGINCGSADIEFNRVTGRYDYFGPFVNKAARVESAALAGGVAVTSAVLEQLEFPLPDHAEYTLHSVQLKGISQSEDLTVLVPRNVALINEVEMQLLTVKKTMGPKTPTRQRSHTETTMSDSIRTAHTTSGVTNVLKEISSLSCCCVSIKEDASYNATLQGLVVALHACDRTDGTVLGVLANNCYVSWNTAKRCNYHIHSALRFAAGCVQNMTGTSCSMGIASGPGHYGAFGYAGRRFITLMGPVLVLAGRLNAAAAESGARCFHAAVPPHESAAADPSVKQRIRPIEVWVYPAFPEPVCVFEVHTEAQMGHWLVTDTEDQQQQPAPSEDATIDSTWGWSGAYWDAFTSRDWDTIEQKIGSADVVGKWAVGVAKQRDGNESTGTYPSLSLPAGMSMMST